MTLKFGILGSGPSGLLAAHAVALAGFRPTILSIKQPSRQYGAQWLHAPIPGVTPQAPEGEVTYHLEGTADGYAKKVYGVPSLRSSFGQFEYDGEAQEVWDLRSAYKRLWTMYENDIYNAMIDSTVLNGLMKEDLCDYWISTLPLKSICGAVGLHGFLSQPVWVSPRASEGRPEENYVVYNGFDDGSWYRTSRVFGHGSTEYPFKMGRSIPKATGLWCVEKPLATECNCFPDVVKLGRFGQWKKGVLTHHVFQSALDYVFDVTGVQVESQGAE